MTATAFEPLPDSLPMRGMGEAAALRGLEAVLAARIAASALDG